MSYAMILQRVLHLAELCLRVTQNLAYLWQVAGTHCKISGDKFSKFRAFVKKKCEKWYAKLKKTQKLQNLTHFVLIISLRSLATWPPLVAHARPLGLMRHSRWEISHFFFSFNFWNFRILHFSSHPWVMGSP